MLPEQKYIMLAELFYTVGIILVELCSWKYITLPKWNYVNFINESMLH